MLGIHVWDFVDLEDDKHRTLGIICTVCGKEENITGHFVEKKKDSVE